MNNTSESVPVLITWGFHSTTGDIYLDAFLNLEEQPEVARMIFLRAQFQHANVSYINIPEGIGRDGLADWMSVNKKEVLKFLNKSKVTNIGQVMRRREETNALDYILHGL